ncbi:uncharacterized protein GIQ15_02269 [Arthroderma uncinatum]|uniref:uncharacterized protein n=1 Tax=Arthroderma uncinatum TaxID=74035 RepID=UPI00144AF9D5|nr:uncharacterized protein GIQ15_02269 [Arthroderma uncinatum]KAF3482945.1 hypothetical protein GIQ15_02269 [Arthroderma uncinatum]
MDRKMDGESPKTEGIEDVKPSRGPKYRHANVYDAVAGRISSNRSQNKSSSLANDYRGTSSTRIFPAVAPEEVLFRRQNASIRYMENDFYFANEDIPEDQPLPDSDLLKAIHTYASDFYGNGTVDHGQSTWRSMDKTALIALGFLLEEAAVEALEETGDMVLVEGEEVSDVSDSESTVEVSTVRSRQTSVSAISTRPKVEAYSSSGFDDGLAPQHGRKKRRRLNSVPIKRSSSEIPAP